VRWGPLKEGDILDRGKLVEVLSAYKFDGVVHFAAHAYVEELVADPQKYPKQRRRNLNLLEAMLEFGLKTIVFSSSCATYGAVDTLPISRTRRRLPSIPTAAPS
jgi:UDP-arabinose 4-epimerase